MYRYVGDGTALPGVPAKDLTEEEAQQYGVRTLLVSKLYVKVKEKPAPKENKLETPWRETKE